MANQNYRGDQGALSDEERRRWRPDDSQQQRGSDRFYGSESERHYNDRPAGRPEEWNYQRSDRDWQPGRSDSYYGRNEAGQGRDRWEERVESNPRSGSRNEFMGQYGNQRNQTGRGQYGTQYGTGQYGNEYRQQMEPGPHRGKGPQSWQRSDERIQDAVNEALTEDEYVDATNIQVQVKNGEVTLSGTVDDRAAKRRAEECVERVSGVKEVQNNIRVQQAGSDRNATQSRGNTPSYDTTSDNNNGKKARA